MISSFKLKRISKQLLLLSAFIIGTTILWYTNNLVDDLRREERTKVNIWANATKQTTDIDNLNEDISFVFEVINHNKTIPVILVDDNGSILYHKNFPSKKANNIDYLKSQLEIMKESHEPIVFEYADGKHNKIYYKDSILLTRLKIFPYIILVVISLFIVTGYFAFSNSRKSEQNKVWAGMARETAHQIGTPLSSLMGWVTLLHDQGGNEEIVSEMNKDILRLQMITERFSKIGSQPELKNQDVNSIVQRSFYYMKDRSSSKINFKLEISDHAIFSFLNTQLFGWVIENIMRNAIDALQGKGEIKVEVKDHSKNVIIDISDNGKGIKSTQLKTVFEPGYTTKLRGWGLGLSLVKRIVEDYHKGQVYILHSKLGKGSTFRISLLKS
ncbi:MAG: two-component sensor histidine kinase [Cryomorphaceae bacterium]|nr:MAG: two-component sensor histidine kinase [Cryomorphaceae bacterium]